MIGQIALFLTVVGALVAVIAYLSKRMSRPGFGETANTTAAPSRYQSVSPQPVHRPMETGESELSQDSGTPYGIVTSKAVIATSSPEVARLLTQADAHVRQEDYTTALQLYTTALKFEPNFITQSNRGLCYLKLKRYHEAMAEFRELISSFPNHSDAATPLNLLGFTLIETGQHKEAIKYFDEALNLNSSSAEIHFNRGVACRHAGQYDEAIKSFETFVHLAPQLSSDQSAILIPKAQTQLEELRGMNAPEIRDAMMNLFGHTNVEEAARAMGFGGQDPPKVGRS